MLIDADHRNSDESHFQRWDFCGAFILGRCPRLGLNCAVGAG
jgi:hypothetical protein